MEQPATRACRLTHWYADAETAVQVLAVDQDPLGVQGSLVNGTCSLLSLVWGLILALQTQC